MTSKHLVPLDHNAVSSIQRDERKRVSANLEIAIRLVDLSWTMLSQAAGYTDLEKPEPDDDTPEKYFHEMKFDALELADGIYGSASESGRLKDDRDLERFKSTGALAEDASPRIQALALLTLAKTLVECPSARLFVVPSVFQD